MYIKSFILVLIASTLASAAPADGDEASGNAMMEVMQGCCESSNFPFNDTINIIMGEEHYNFCEHDESKSWAECFFQKMGLFDENQNLLKINPDEHVNDDDDPKKKEIGENCALEMINLDDKKQRSCFLMSCFKNNGMMAPSP